MMGGWTAGTDQDTYGGRIEKARGLKKGRLAKAQIIQFLYPRHPLKFGHWPTRKISTLVHIL